MSDDKVTLEDLVYLLVAGMCTGCKPYHPDGYTLADCPIHGQYDPNMERILNKLRSNHSDSPKPRQ